jgi:putative tryptophan/tyrosine transport system substrate-binding protein
MRRRDFIKVIGGVAAIWPVAARAQQAERIRRIGVLAAIAESDPSAQPMAAAFEGTLAQLGWTKGKNVAIEYRWSGSDAGTMRRQVAELIALTPDVIFVGGAEA